MRSSIHSIGRILIKKLSLFIKQKKKNNNGRLLLATSPNLGRSQQKQSKILIFSFHFNKKCNKESRECLAKKSQEEILLAREALMAFVESTAAAPNQIKELNTSNLPFIKGKF